MVNACDVEYNVMSLFRKCYLKLKHETKNYGGNRSKELKIYSYPLKTGLEHNQQNKYIFFFN